jgi:hypothetical protein
MFSKRLALAVVAVFALAGGIAYAAIPDADSTYHACMLKGVGTIRIVDPERQRCSAALETEITFGARGPQGLPGTQGAPGAHGTNGVSPTVAQIGAGTNCANGGAAITDANGSTAYVCSGANGNDGAPFAGTFTSQNGDYSIAVDNSGISLHGPGGTSLLVQGTDISITTGGNLNIATQNMFNVNATGSASVRSSNLINIQAAARLHLVGSIVDIN